MWVWIVAIVVIGGILAFWIANAARLANKNKNLKPRSPVLFDPDETPAEREQRIQQRQDDRKGGRQ